MAPLKRKKPHDAGATEAQPQSQPQPQPPRRATRRHPAAEEQNEQPEKQLRSGRVRANTIEKEKPTEVLVPKSTRSGSGNGTAKAAKITRGAMANATNGKRERTLKENIKPRPEDNEEDELANTSVSSLGSAPLPAPAHTATAQPPPPQTRLLPPSHKPSLQHPHSHSRPTPSTATEKISTPKRAIGSSDKPPKPPGTPRSDRNIDKVVLGNICFKAWYPSYYGKEVLGDMSGNNSNTGAKEKGVGGKMGGGKRAGLPPPMLDRLYVCPCCFKYSRELVMWWEHVKLCEKSFEIPGTKVYTHPKGSRTVRVPLMGAAAEGVEKGKGRGRKKSDSGAGVDGTREEVVQDRGEWSVWEVDGEKDRVSHSLAMLPFKSVANFWWIAILPEPLPVRQALPRQQVRLLRRHRLQLLSPRLHAASAVPC